MWVLIAESQDIPVTVPGHKEDRKWSSGSIGHINNRERRNSFMGKSGGVGLALVEKRLVRLNGDVAT